MSTLGRIRYRIVKDAVLPVALSAADALGRARRRGTRRVPPDWAGPPLTCARELKRIMTRHYLLARQTRGAMPVAWVTSGFPVEIARVLGFYSVYPENHGAICGARKVGPDMCSVAEKEGFSQDLCSYARIDLGVALGARGPVGRLPRPDVLLCCTNICQTVMYWYKQLAWLYRVPLILFDTPFVAGELDDASVAYMAGQLRDCVPALERIARRPFDDRVFREILERARCTSALWGRCLATLTARPAPMSIFDAFAHMAPVVSLRGLPVAERYYEILLAELEQRRAQGVGALKQERHRLLWDNIAIWFRVADLAKTLARAGCAVVAATYTSAWAETVHHLDPERPFESMARTYSLVVLNRDLRHRLELMRRMIRDYSIDGVVFHSTRSCKPYSLGQYDIQRLLAESGTRGVIIEADTTDFRHFAEESARTRLEAFLELLDN